IPGNFATNLTVTLAYTNASGTISNAVFTNSVSVIPSGQGVTASIAATTAPTPDNGGTVTLPLTISAAASDVTNTSYQIIVSATNGAFTANVPPGFASITNTLNVGGLYSPASFSMGLAPASVTVLGGIATNVSVTVTFTNVTGNITEPITNG